MTGVPKPNNTPLCSGCLRPTNEPVEIDGDRFCRSCDNVFFAAMVLWAERISAESEVIPTLVCARKVGFDHQHDVFTPDPMLARLSALRVVKRVRGGVPIVRVLPLTGNGETHRGTRVLKRVHLQVLSKNVKPVRVGAEYERVVTEHGATWERNNHGRFAYEVLVGPLLQLSIGAGPNVTPQRVEGLGGDLSRHPAWHFPSPHLVANVYKAILTSAQYDDSLTFKLALDLYGKPNAKSPERIIPAFVAWHLGAQKGPHAGETVSPKERLRVARLLNKHLLDESHGLRRIPEDSQCSGDRVWSDVQTLWPRFVRLEMLLPLG